MNLRFREECNSNCKQKGAIECEHDEDRKHHVKRFEHQRQQITQRAKEPAHRHRETDRSVVALRGRTTYRNKLIYQLNVKQKQKDRNKNMLKDIQKKKKKVFVPSVRRSYLVPQIYNYVSIITIEILCVIIILNAKLETKIH